MERMDIGYRFYNRIRNVGDAIIPYVLEELTGFKPALVKYDVPHLLGCGSIFFMATDASYVWGTGILNPDTHIPPISAQKITALRGKKSYELLSARGFQLNDIPLGDPGIFAAEVLRKSKFIPRNRYRAAVVPHHSSILHPFYTHLKGSKEFALVNVLDDTLEPLRLIEESDIVITQSLHGLVFAASLEKPSVWISEQFSPNWQFKFEDWFSTSTNPQHVPLPLGTDIEALCSLAEIRKSSIDKPSLQKAIPIESVIHELGQPVYFGVCRSIQPITISVPRIFSGRLFHDYLEALAAAQGVLGVTDNLNAVFERFAERTYACLQPDDEDIPVSQAQLRAICAYLDHTLEPDLCYLIPRDRLLSSDVVLRKIGANVDVVENAKIIGGAILLRPDVGSMSENFITFAV